MTLADMLITYGTPIVAWGGPGALAAVFLSPFIILATGLALVARRYR